MLRRVFCKLLLVVVVIFSLLVLSGTIMARGRSADAYERVREVQERHNDRLLAIEDVEGTAIGLDENDRPAVKLFTARRRVRGIPKELDGIPVQVIVTGKIYALIDTSARVPRPVPTGVSTGHPDITAGTIACRVKDAGGNVYALSNNHIYANENRASIGDNVLQPGPSDGGVDPDDAIGTLAAFQRIRFSRRARNEIDAAIALSSTSLLGNATPSPFDGGYGTPSSITVGAVLSQQVQKFGRTTELTKGVITGVNVTVNVGYERGTARFVKQIIVESGTPFIGGGDSGSLLVTDNADLNPVGLLFAGTSDGLLAVANPIDLVLNRFGVTVDSEEAPPEESLMAEFVGIPTSGHVPLKVLFTDISTGNPSGWSWSFGDGGTSTKQDPSHIYTAAATYTVSLTVTGPSDSDTLTKTDYIEVTTLPLPPTLVSMVVTPETASTEIGSTQQYTAIGTYSDSSTTDITNDVVWTSSDIGIATFDMSGLAEGTGVGDTEITASLDLVTSNTATLTVTEVPIEKEVFSDSFESSADWTANWSQDSQNDWRRRTSRKKEGNYAAEVDGRATNAQLISIPIDLQGKANATITFWWYIERGLDTGEYLAFDVSTDGGAWIEKAKLRGNVDPENQWHNVSINVTGINNNNLRVRFRGTMSSSREDAYVDVVKVVAW